MLSVSVVLDLNISIVRITRSLRLARRILHTKQSCLDRDGTHSYVEIEKSVTVEFSYLVVSVLKEGVRIIAQC